MTEPLQTILDRREAVIKILERDAQDAHDKLANAAAELHCLHARIAELEARVQELGAMARENRSRRIVELEAQLEAERITLKDHQTIPHLNSTMGGRYEGKELQYRGRR